MKKIIINLNNYESSDEIKKVADAWNEEFEKSVLINRYNKMRLLPCTFKHILNDAKLPEFEKLRLLKDGVNQILELIKTDSKYSLYYTKNVECILTLELTGTKHFDTYLNKIPAEDFWNLKWLNQALKEMKSEWGPFLRLV